MKNIYIYSNLFVSNSKFSQIGLHINRIYLFSSQSVVDVYFKTIFKIISFKHSLILILNLTSNTANDCDGNLPEQVTLGTEKNRTSLQLNTSSLADFTTYNEIHFMATIAAIFF